jgi:hypothetical protein
MDGCDKTNVDAPFRRKSSKQKRCSEKQSLEDWADSQQEGLGVVCL